MKVYKTLIFFKKMEEEFKDIKQEENNQENEEQKPVRVRLPRGKEVIGILEQRHGGNKMLINCLDGKSRNCRVPGRLKRALWLRPRDVVIISPWEFDDSKGDVIFKYRLNQIEWLKKHGYLKTESSEF